MTLLLLAGTGEARKIAFELAEKSVPTIASLAGATRQPPALAVPMRVGGFGGETQFSEYLTATGITAVLDATHPFAVQMSRRAHRVCQRLEIPCVQLLRPGWSPVEGDLWTDLADEAEAANHIERGATVFLATGRQTLDRFQNLQGRRIICRQIDPPDRPFPFPGGEFLIGRPPFSVEDEVALFRKLGVDWLIVKNAGGAASATKLTAARQLGIRVGMIQRPPNPPGAKLESVADAVAWAVMQCR